MNIDIKNILATGERVTLECKKAQIVSQFLFGTPTLPLPTHTEEPICA